MFNSAETRCRNNLTEFYILDGTNRYLFDTSKNEGETTIRDGVTVKIDSTKVEVTNGGVTDSFEKRWLETNGREYFVLAGDFKGRKKGMFGLHLTDYIKTLNPVTKNLSHSDYVVDMDQHTIQFRLMSAGDYHPLYKGTFKKESGRIQLYLKREEGDRGFLKLTGDLVLKEEHGKFDLSRMTITEDGTIVAVNDGDIQLPLRTLSQQSTNSSSTQTLAPAPEATVTGSSSESKDAETEGLVQETARIDPCSPIGIEFDATGEEPLSNNTSVPPDNYESMGVSTEYMAIMNNFDLFKIGIDIDLPLSSRFFLPISVNFLTPMSEGSLMEIDPVWYMNVETGETKLVREVEHDWGMTMGLGAGMMIYQWLDSVLSVRASGHIGGFGFDNNPVVPVSFGGGDVNYHLYMLDDRFSVGAFAGGGVFCNIRKESELSRDCHGLVRGGLRFSVQ